MKRILMILILAGIAGYAPMAMGLPNQINYQGYLTRPDGTPLDTTVAMTFVIHSEETNNDYWTESHPAVVVTNGLFSVILGTINPLGDFVVFANDRTLGVTIGNNTQMTPRQPIVSTARSIYVGTVNGASGGSISGDVWITGKAKIGMENDNSGDRAFVAGYQNTATGMYSTIPGGWHNTASGNRSVVGGGVYNTASQENSSVSGGNNNWATNYGATIGGGVSNRASGYLSVVAGGGGTASDSNSASGDQSFIGGGSSNYSSGLYSSVGGGLNNTASGTSSAIAGGNANIASGYNSYVGGGRNNRARGYLSAVAGGGGVSASDSNSASGTYSFVGGGNENTASGDSTVVCGGANNTASLNGAVIVGGRSNSATGEYACVGGGRDNTASGGHSTIGGGFENTCVSGSGTICGGYRNWNTTQSFAAIGGGFLNYAGGAYSTIPGGYNNRATGAFSFACGHNAQTAGDGSFVFADSNPDTFNIGSSNTFNARASNGIRFWTTGNQDDNIGVRVLGGGSAWITLSDSTKKRNIRVVDTKDILDKVTRMPIKQWSYKSQDPNMEHIGPMAQDFWNTFHIGEDSLGISTIDPSGIALAAIQELKKENDNLKIRLAKLEALLSASPSANLTQKGN